MFFRLQELVKFAGIVLEDSLVFTYWGNVNFSVILFDKSKVEKTKTGELMNKGMFLFLHCQSACNFFIREDNEGELKWKE